VAQSAAASFNPAHKLIDQHTEAPVQHSVMSRGEAQEDAMDLYRRMQLPNPDEIGFRYPHQVSGGQLAARHDRDGDGLPPGPHHLRRADHRA
jgi:peptide/nickel transport system ATP-binding protein